MEDTKRKLEALGQYASEVPVGAPPEILPWEPDEAWGLEEAARAALAMILEEAPASDETFAVADYLLTFNTPGYKARFHPSVMDGDGRLLNGTALALFGYLYPEHPEAELWRVCGCARLASVAHQRKAALEKRSMADCVRAVCDVARELGAPILADLVTLEERMWGQLVDHSRAERLRIRPEDYGRQMVAPVEANELGAMLKGRAWQKRAATPDFLMQADLVDADGICENLVTLRAHMLVRHQFGDDIDWHLRLFDDVESTVSLNAQPFVRNLVSAYETTGQDKYAEATARILRSWYDGCPMPNHWHLQGPWRTLEVGNRQCNMWPAAMAVMGGHDAFDDDLHAMLAHSRLDHIRYAMAFCGGANNWYQVEASGLACAALFSPELNLADAYLRVAMRRLQWINSFAYYDDGFQFELTHGYHVFPTSSLFAVVRTAKAREIDLPEDFTSLVERAHDMYLFSAQPDYLLPTFNDCNPNPTDPAALLGAASEAFDRDDFRWGATHGEEGTAPDHCSHAWNDAGLYVMRDQWGPDGQHLFFDGAPWGASHQHDDKLNFSLYSHGRLLIGDPNIYSYAATELTHYFKSARAHNVVMIDGMGQMRRFDDEAKLTTKGDNAWVSEAAFDFVSSEYCEAFGVNRFQAEGQPDLVDTIVHKRSMFYVKGEYWILCDRIQGADSERHTFEQLFHPAPIFDLEGDVPVRAGEIETDQGRIVTQDAGLGNLAILPVDAEGLEITSKKGETSPAAGWYGVLGEIPAWEVSCKGEGIYPHRMDAVLFPMGAGETEHPSAERLYADEWVTAFEIKGAGVDDVFIMCEPGCPEVMVDDVVFKGRCGLVRRGEGKVEARGVGIERVEVGGKAVGNDH
jgi:hypothetical protein